MGAHEFDRIRSKNAVYEAAYNLYTNLQNEGLSDSDIESYVQSLLTDNLNFDRSEVYSTVLRIVGRSRVKDGTAS